MDDVVIRAEKLSKAYDIRHSVQVNRYSTIQETLLSLPKKLFGKHQTTERFWALKEVSFEVRRGDRVGIIGRNGAGKSTLLKLLTKITEPTSGQAIINGRVASLLEVGTGFHPELTGRENIFMNGAILGMSRAEIRKKFDEIVAFAEVEKFIDTPVKRYSSGMYVRLAFAVAAHLEPEILLVDEVLAVGDAHFQKKCLGKMEDVSKNEERTVLFVSHNMPMISSLCETCILLHEGRILRMGATSEVIQAYYSKGIASDGSVDFTKDGRAHGDETARILHARMTNEEGGIVTESLINRSVIIEMEYEITLSEAKVSPNFLFYTSEGVCAFMSSDVSIDPKSDLKKEKGIYRAKCILPANFLNQDTYYIGLALTTPMTQKVHFYEKEVLQLNVVDPLDNVETRGQIPVRIPGVVRPLLRWECEKIS